MENFSTDIIAAQLERVLVSSEFMAGRRLGQFLRYVVGQALNGHSDKLDQYTIAVEALGYEPGFDPVSNPAVRILASRLRRALGQYYANHGSADPIRIDIPKGGYNPIFRDNHPVFQVASSIECPSPTPSPEAYEFYYPTIAVISFKSMNNESFGYLATGLTEEIIIALTRFAELKVIGPIRRDVILQKHFGPRRIGQEYNIRFLLDGNMRLRDQSLRILAKLTDTLNGQLLWGQVYEYDIEKTAINQLENEIVSRVVAEIADSFGAINRSLSKEVLSHRNDYLSDYEAVLRFHHYNRTLTETSMTEAITALEKVVQRDHENDLAMALLADLLGVPYFIGFVDDISGLERSEELARQALALNPRSQQAHYAMAQIHYQRFQQAPCLAAIERVLELNPHNANYIAVSALFLLGLGQWERSQTLIKRAIHLNPHHPGWYHFVPFMYHYCRGEFKTALVDAHGFNTPHYFWDSLIRTAVFGQLGRQAEAKKAGGELVTLVPDFERRGRSLIRRMVYDEENTEALLDGLRKAGLGTLSKEQDEN